MSDLISRQAALDAIQQRADRVDSVYSAFWEGLIIAQDIVKNIPSAETEPEEFEWCTDCKEYDQEKHCCHRWTKVIRQTVEEMKSAEPERKTGKWEVQPSTGGDRPYIWWKCSECGHVIFSETERDRREFHAFCGRCGADMRGE